MLPGMPPVIVRQYVVAGSQAAHDAAPPVPAGAASTSRAAARARVIELDARASAVTVGEVRLPVAATDRIVDREATIRRHDAAARHRSRAAAVRRVVVAHLTRRAGNGSGATAYRTAVGAAAVTGPRVAADLEAAVVVAQERDTSIHAAVSRVAADIAAAGVVVIARQCAAARGPHRRARCGTARERRAPARARLPARRAAAPRSSAALPSRAAASDGASRYLRRCLPSRPGPRRRRNRRQRLLSHCLPRRPRTTCPPRRRGRRRQSSRAGAPNRYNRRQSPPGTQQMLRNKRRASKSCLCLLLRRKKRVNPSATIERPGRRRHGRHAIPRPTLGATRRSVSTR